MMSELVEKTKIIERGKGSLAIAISKKTAKDHFGDAEKGTPVEIRVENGRFFLVFPNAGEPADSEIFK